MMYLFQQVKKENMGHQFPEIIQPDYDLAVSDAKSVLAGHYEAKAIAIAIFAGLTIVARAIYELEHTIRCINHRGE